MATLNTQIEDTQAVLDDFTEPLTAVQEVELGRLRNTLSQYQSSYANVLQSFENLRLTEVQSVDSIVMAEPAEVPEEPVRPRVLINTLLAAIASAMAALGVVFLFEYLDDGVKSPVELQNLVAAPFLGAVARMKLNGTTALSATDALITMKAPRHPISEAFRSVRTNLQFSSVDQTLNSVLVTSANPGDVKTTVAANLAIVMAQSGRSVILVDADLRKPQLHRVFGFAQSPGLTDLLLSGDDFTAQHLADPSHNPELSHLNLRILPSGKQPPNPSELLGSQRMAHLITQIQAEADLIIFDAPPLRAVTDAQVLSNLIDGVMLVVNTGANRNAVAQAAAALQTVNARLLGTVLNRLARSSRSYNSYYDYYTQQYYAADDADSSGDDNGNDNSNDNSNSGSSGPRTGRGDSHRSKQGRIPKLLTGPQPASLAIERGYSQV